MNWLNLKQYSINNYNKINKPFKIGLGWITIIKSSTINLTNSVVLKKFSDSSIFFLIFCKLYFKNVSST